MNGSEDNPYSLATPKRMITTSCLTSQIERFLSSQLIEPRTTIMKTNLPMGHCLPPKSGFLSRSTLFKTCLSFVLLLTIIATATAQTLRDFTSKVVSANNKPVVAAAVQNLNKVLSTKSADDGSFTIQAATGDSLKIVANGYKTIVYIVSEATMPIILTDVDEVTMVPVAPIQRIYTTIPTQLDVSSNAAIYSPDILKTPVTSFTNAVTGRLTGLYSIQLTGLPGSDFTNMSLRGQTPLIIIDGVVANLTNFDLEEIESITVQKDAIGNAMLGSRGAHGAIIITTKKGKEGQQRLSFTAQTAVQQAIGFPKTLNAYDYARLHNEALRNDGVDSAFSGAYYTSTALQAYQTHSDLFNYPDVNYLEQITKKSSLFNKYTLSASGGNRFARYFVSLENVGQAGFFKTVDSNSYNTNNNFSSYVIRSNVDININSKLSGGINLLGRILNGNQPGATSQSIIANLLSTPANAYPLLNANGSYGGSQLYQNNLLAQTISSGYLQTYKRDILANFYLKRTMDDITPGLWIQAKASYYATLSETVYRGKTFAVYQQSGSAYSQYGSNGTQANGNGVDFQGRTDYEELSIGYDRTFNKKHGVNILLLANRDNSTNGPGNSTLATDLPYTIIGTSGRLSYNYMGKYVVEAAFGLNGSNRYPDNGKTKLGFFPSVGLGWNMEQEDFLKNVSWLSRLKLYGSFGKTGWDNPGYFIYYNRYFDGPGYTLGTSAGGVTTITEGTLPNKNITFEKADKLNLGIDGSILKNHLGFKVEYFRNKNYDLVMQRATNSTIIGNDYPNENIGQNRYTGWEGQLNWQQSFKKVQYFISVNASTLSSKWLYFGETNRPYPWMYQTGQPVGQGFGYVADGLFQTQAEINSSATTVGYKAQPGDIKYKDLNADGVIDQNDRTAIGKISPLITYGMSLGLSYKGFDISALIQGVANNDIYLSGNSYWSFQNNGTGQGYTNALNRWTPTNTNANYPRLTYGTNSNNQAASSYWYKNGNFIRLKNAEVGYSLPKSLIGKIKLEQVRLFINGYNLLTSASSSLDGRDPESYFGVYPLQRLYNFGINVKF